MLVRRLALCLTVVPLLTGCPGELTSDAGADAALTGCEGAAPATLDELFPQYLAGVQPTGCTAGCHGQGQGGLAFTSAESFHAATVGKKAANGHTLVEPGNALASEVYLRLLPSAAARMPLGGAPFDDAALAKLAGWICAGAPAPSGAGDAGSDAGTPEDAGTLSLTSFAPLSGVVGTTVTLSGTGFSPSAASNTVRFGSVGASVVSSTGSTLVTRVPAGAVTAPVSVTVAGSSATSATDFVVEQGNPTPQLTTLAPSTALVGSADLPVTATGDGFVDGGVIRVDGTALPTVITSATSLSFTLPAAALATAGVRQLTLTTPAPGGGTSAPLAFTVANPAPTASSASPSTLITNGAPVTVQVSGSGFVATTTATFDGAAVTRTVTSPTTLEIAVPTVTTDGNHTLTVSNPAPGGGSASLTLTSSTVTLPTISSLTPSPAPANTAFSLTVGGANFTCTASGARVLFGASTLTPTSCAGTQLVVNAPATAAGTVQVQVRNPNMDLSAAVPLTLVTPNPLPTLSTLTPSSANAGTAGMMVQVTGTGFVSGTVATWAGAARPTTVSSATSLTLSLSLSDLSAPGVFDVAVVSPAPGGGTSTTLPFTVVAVNPVPTLTSLTPASLVTGSGAATVTATGSSFAPGATASFNGSPRSTTVTSSTSLTFSLSSADVATGGLFPVTVSNPAPGGGTSSSVSLAIGAPTPTLSAVTPCGVLANTAATLTVTGSGFTSSSVVRFNGTALATTFASSTTLIATLPASIVGNAPALGGAATLTVNTPAPGGGTSNALTFGVAATNATLAGQVQPIFTSSCVGSGCHGTVNAQGGLVLTSGNARAQLLDVMSTGCVGKLRVVACNPTRAGSVLVDKILATGANPACAGSAMPKAQPLTAAEKQAIVDWIALGAAP
ncbi:MAG: beta strand repeat-containing protein [Myxococcota bacterium]